MQPSSSSLPGAAPAGSSLPELAESETPVLQNALPEALPMEGSTSFPFGLQPVPDPYAAVAPCKRPKRSKQPKEKVLPPDLDVEGPSSNAAYQATMADPSVTFAPQELGFLPSNYWLNTDTTFNDMVTKFFQRKNNANCRFPHKLYNGLLIVDNSPNMYNLIGVKWVTDKVIKVDKLIFGRLLGISSIDGGLFHKQGNFPSHGFAEVSVDETEKLRHEYDLSDVDLDRVRLMYHKLGMFVKGSDEEAVTKCKWVEEQKPQQ